MDNPERSESSHELSSWVNACSDLLAPPADWEPNLDAARARLEACVDARRRRRSGLKRYLLAGAMAVLLACVVVPAIPHTRAFAQQIGNRGWLRLEQLWYWITIVRSGPILMGKLSDAMEALHTQQLAKPESPEVVSSAAEAALRAGFTPRFPDSSVLTGSPRLSVLGPMSFVTVINTADLALALRKAGALDQQVPRQWDGAQLTLQIGATVTARWSNVSEQSGGSAWSDLTLVQGPAPVVTAPPGFDLETFAVAGLRAAGMRNRDMILRFARRATTAPALLSGYLPPFHVGVDPRTGSKRLGFSTLIEELNAGDQSNWFGPRVERFTLLWSKPNRVYVLSGVTKTPTYMFSPDFAAALANAIDVADTID
jgi:hypothetical protein